MEKKRLNQEFLDEFKNYDFSKIIENKIYLVGSITKAKDYFIKIESILQIIYKKLVSICSVDGLLNKNLFSSDEWDKLQEIAIRKLNEQEAILVLDVENYIGDQTREEIEYFETQLKRPIYYLSNLEILSRGR
ncbi:MAG: hypothetical protein ACFFDO_08230 [Candidatus Thorarchaeota archaeon]